MKAIRILRNNIVESFKGIFRNFSLSFASILCISITLLLVGFSILLTLNVNNFTKNVENDMTIVVFLERKINSEDIDSVEKQINDLNNIKEITYNSKESVKSSMEEESEIFKSILDDYTEETNPLQDTYLVKVEDATLISETANEIKNIEHVDVVKYGEGSVEELIKIFDVVTKIMYIVVIALVIITAFLISNTIKLTIQNRQREIEIRRLVGASNTYIRQPFFIEGTILGFFGAIIPISVCCFGYKYIYDKLGGRLFTDIISLIKPSSIIYSLALVLLCLGIIVGAFGSFRAVRKFLKI